jgi:segregation and condensation protein B
MTDEQTPNEPLEPPPEGVAGTLGDGEEPDITPELLESSGLPPLRAALEAVLLVTDEPVPSVTLAQVTERPTDEVEQTLRLLADEYVEGERGFELRNVAGGWRLYTRPDCAPYVERFVLDGQSARLTQAALETLAVIAYRQPVTRSRVSAVRGVNVDGVIRTLLARGLITESGHDEDTGGLLYRTTPMLLERLGLQSLDELPSLAPLLPELDELDSAQPST